jgi:hypothetical protein
MTNKQAYWINLAKTNPDEFKRRRRMAYWKHLQQNNPEEYKARQRENKLRQKNQEMSSQEAHKIIATQDLLFEKNQLSFEF